MSYDFSTTALFHPEQRPVFVSASSMPAFQKEGEGLSLCNAWWLANACQLAYFDPADITSKLATIGLQLIHFFSGPSTQAYVATGDGFAWLVFRGTEIGEPPDILADSQFTLVPFVQDSEAHQGFLDALHEVWDQIEPILATLQAQGLPLWTTGYSLGAALASLASVYHPPTALYTFGSPRVGDLTFTQLLRKVPAQRFVNCTDIVPTVPLREFRYWHLGHQQFLTATGRLLSDPTSWQVARRKLAGSLLYALKLPWLHDGMVKLRTLADHAILNYIAGIERSL